MDGRDAPLGQPGELCIKGPQVMAGYWNKPDETANVMTEDGYLRTGDIARIDERGYVYLVDRKKDMILVSGFNVYPNEIEDVVMTHPGVHEVGAVGVPDARSGEAVKIVVVRKDESCHRRRDHRPLPPAPDRLQDAAPRRIPRHAAALADRQDPAPRAEGEGRGEGASRRRRPSRRAREATSGLERGSLGRAGAAGASAP